jgi:hypothetical protein
MAKLVHSDSNREIKQCPGCGGWIPNNENPGAYPGALSRYDNHTEICSDCGQKEALAQFFSQDPDAVIQPGAVVHEIINEDDLRLQSGDGWFQEQTATWDE